MAEWQVLVVEDDPVVARVHCRFVAQQAGFVLAGAAGSAKRARALIAHARPDLVLLDLELPGETGVSLLRELRSSGQPTEVVVVTAHATAKVVRACAQLGVVDYLVKPFWPWRLGEALATFSARMAALHAGQRLDQDAIDHLLSGPGSRSGEARLPPGVTPDRLELVRATLAAEDRPLTAEEVAAEAGIARVTARRYLECLVARGQCTVDATPAGPGRPRKAYRIWLSDQVGAAG